MVMMVTSRARSLHYPMQLHEFHANPSQAVTIH